MSEFRTIQWSTVLKAHGYEDTPGTAYRFGAREFDHRADYPADVDLPTTSLTGYVAGVDPGTPENAPLASGGGILEYDTPLEYDTVLEY